MLRPLLQRHPDLTFHRLSIVVMPVQHLVRWGMIDRTGGPDLRSVTSRVGFLCQPDGVLGGRANLIYPPAK
ncbi:hypothetical protein E8L99_13080 [Phreatobacter aquaticus]|uniref:Uncharacterized protein n=1 Tax=Phreatobacter aquaticus TaxID=2570229 RepID=A0A4D7QKV8_9HYPH|nr:hypothetical protein [Phreatobacter aquaticus]QCK86623.1 hypothetical protein E8L99_13080 [Phreatobacter aquaticus]